MIFIYTLESESKQQVTSALCGKLSIKINFEIFTFGFPGHVLGKIKWIRIMCCYCCCYMLFWQFNSHVMTGFNFKFVLT